MKKNLYRLGMVLAMSAGWALAQGTASQTTTTPKTFPDQQQSPSSAQSTTQNPTSAQPQSSDQLPSSSQTPSSSSSSSTSADRNVGRLSRAYEQFEHLDSAAVRSKLAVKLVSIVLFQQFTEHFTLNVRKRDLTVQLIAIQ